MIKSTFDVVWTSQLALLGGTSGPAPKIPTHQPKDISVSDLGLYHTHEHVPVAFTFVLTLTKLKNTS